MSVVGDSGVADSIVNAQISEEEAKDPTIILGSLDQE